jgi:hypothetical protein
MARPANPNSHVKQTFTDYSASAVTTGTNKREWVALFGGRIVAHARAETAGTGAGNTDLDVKVNGTSVLARVLRLATGVTGEFTQGEPASRASVRPGDRISYDVAAVPATTGAARVSISIAIVAP